MRTITRADELDTLRWADGGLLPVVAQDALDGRVLMVAWANREALEASLRTGQLHFWSRSRGELWRKGATSGNVLELQELRADCDADTLLARVLPAGPACHTGAPTCFGNAAPTLAALDALLRGRAEERLEGSYTTRLLEDRNLRLKKLSEEAGELVVALADGERDAVAQEAADLLYHLLVACRSADVELADVLAVLEARSG